MPKFLLITDNTTYLFGGPRYLGPYRLADELENAGIRTVVLDHFYDFPDFFSFLENLIDDSYIGVGISTTFFTPPDFLGVHGKHASNRARSRSYYDFGIVSSNSEARRNWFADLRALLDRRAPKAKIFIGGTKAQFFSHRIYDGIDQIDYFVMGVVDLVFPAVLEEMIRQGAPRYRTFEGRKVIDTATAYVQPKVCPEHGWRDHWFVQKGEVLPIEISRGCAFNCKFCTYDKRVSARKNPDSLRRELMANYERHGTQFYHFVDDCFNDSRTKVEEVCNVLASLPFKLEWVSYMRFDVAIKFPHTMDMIVESGGRAFHWGVESLTYEVAKRAGKGTHPDLIKDFIVQFHEKEKGRCYSLGSFISGLPGETDDSWRRQIEWLTSVENFDFVNISPLGVAPYKADFDGTAIDYAEYSRNPAKYGFQEIDLTTGYWKHDTMDQVLATDHTNWAMGRWREKMKGRTGASTDVWMYPKLRSFGFSPEEVYQFYFSEDSDRIRHLTEIGLKVARSRKQRYIEQMMSLLPGSADNIRSNL